MVYALDIREKFLPAQFDSLSAILNQIIPLLSIGAAIIFLGMFLFGAFRIIIASGDPEKIKESQATFQFATIGLIIVVTAYLIVKLIGIILNISGSLPL